MSRWSHDGELTVVVSPDQVTLLHVQRKLTLRGRRREVRDAHCLPCNAAGPSPWGAALLELQTALPSHAGDSTAATVILSNRFLLYTLVPWRAEVANAAEELAFTRHCFTRIYGERAQNWELRVNPQGGQWPALASATDAELLDGLKTVFAEAGIGLRSVQPHLMAAVNRFRHKLGRCTAWLALLEPGNLCLALLQRGRWQRVRTVRIGSAWQTELPMVLDRESYLAELPEVPRDVYLLNVGSGAIRGAESGSWKFHVLASGEDADVGTAPGLQAWMAG